MVRRSVVLIPRKLPVTVLVRGRPGVSAAGLGQLTLADASLAPANEVDANLIEPSAPAMKSEANLNGSLEAARRRLLDRVARWPPATGATAEIRLVSVR